MARSFSNAKNVSALIANEISRRGYCATATSQTVRVGAPKMMLKKESEKTAWVPDPETGYYRPENMVKEVDPAELRQMLLKTKTTQD